MPWADQQLITLVALEGYSMADAAEVLGISVAAVKSRMHRLRQRLRPGPQPSAREVTPCPERP
ncbi:RNA polymerase sigma factor [Tessaracoccus coleopterorum]|uniref:RNA polymerase sigma factor n=1 Tax=Tessaracoccus coleopterorum TaxID=2714950 RepID=UPI0038CD20A7